MRGWVLAVAIGLTAGAGAQEATPVDGARGPWMVFFDWGKGEMRRDDAETLDMVAAAWRERSSGHLTLAGHTDRSGSAAVNQAAGFERARTVRAELEKRGIPRNAISVASFGEQQPLVPTEDGVREIQNRRVVIAIEE